MMAARGNAANKAKEAKRKAKEEAKRDDKRESKMGLDGFGLSGLSEEEMAKLAVSSVSQRSD